MKIAVIGGGAAGFFAAISSKKHHPLAEVTLFEKTKKILTKVKISGGGRCNVTNGCLSNQELLKGYPRGKNALKKVFGIFNNLDTIRWFESRGVALKTEADGRVFPVSNNSQSIIDCLLKEINLLNIDLVLNREIKSVEPQIFDQNKVKLIYRDERLPVDVFDRVIIATGGSPKRINLQWLEDLGHKIIDPVPSLFTFNIPEEKITKLMGVVVPHTSVSLQGSKRVSSGPLLITHWGMSGPAILKMSAFAARELHQLGYDFNIIINWISIKNHEEVYKTLNTCQLNHTKKNLANIRPFDLPDRLWIYLLEKVKLKSDKKWGELGNKSLHRLVNVLMNDSYHVSGKTTFKEEFVTSGGINMSSIDVQTMASKVCPHVYFAGEILNIDGITGGYNFQAAWTTAYVAGQLK